jgi:hypothetical protein
MLNVDQFFHKYPKATLIEYINYIEKEKEKNKQTEEIDKDKFIESLCGRYFKATFLDNYVAYFKVGKPKSGNKWNVYGMPYLIFEKYEGKVIATISDATWLDINDFWEFNPNPPINKKRSKKKLTEISELEFNVIYNEFLKIRDLEKLL